MPKNKDPFAVWNDTFKKDDPFAPHNSFNKDSPFKPWNSTFTDYSKLSESEKRYYGIRNKSNRSDEDE